MTRQPIGERWICEPIRATSASAAGQ